MNLKDVISADSEVMGGQTVFKGTRVPVESLFDHLEAGITIDSFLEDFPTVSKQQVVVLLEYASKLLNTKNLDLLYASVA